MIFVSFIIVSFISIVIWTIYRGYLFKKNKSINLFREIILLIFFLYFLILLNLTVFKSGSIEFVNPLNTSIYKQYGIKGVVNFIPFKETINTLINEMVPIANPIRNIVGNMLVFMPLGFLIPLLFDNFNNFKKILALGVLSSLLIEITQLFINGNACDIDDIIYNTIGAVVGWIFFKIFVKLVHKINLEEKLNQVRSFNDNNLLKKSLKVVVLIGILSMGYYIFSIFDQTVSGDLSDTEMVDKVFGYEGSQILKTIEINEDKFYLVKNESGVTVLKMIEYIKNQYVDSKYGFSMIEDGKCGYFLDFIYYENSDGYFTNNISPLVFGRNDNASKIILKVKDIELGFDIEKDDYFMVNLPSKIYLSNEEMSNLHNRDVFSVTFLDKDNNEVNSIKNLTEE
ncbi:MAG: VanZ family protein [Romboutsia sp.]